MIGTDIKKLQDLIKSLETMKAAEDKKKQNTKNEVNNVVSNDVIENVNVVD